MRAPDLFKGRHFDREIIVLCARWYLRFGLSSRDLVQMMEERGVDLTHTTILRWVQRYVPEFAKRWNQYARPVSGCNSSNAPKHPSFFRCSFNAFTCLPPIPSGTAALDGLAA